MNSKRLFFILMSMSIVFFTSGCRTVSQIPVSSKPASNWFPQISDLKIAKDFVPGYSNIPTGYVLFLRYYTHENCVGSCGCPDLEPNPPAYSFDGVELFLLDREITEFDQALGIAIFGWLNEAVDRIDTLPYAAPNEYFQLYSIDENGVVVITIDQETYVMEPGQVWGADHTVVKDADCEFVYTTRLVNYGLVTIGNATR